MTTPVRVGDSLNQALTGLLKDNDRLVVLGEDIVDPYGGAFGVTRGLSTRYSDRVINTPISEEGIVGVAGGLALCGESVIVEVMFGDFILLCADPLVNFITKSVSMYGRRLRMPVIIRCPVGGHRGYGPTHSQCPQKHFIGVPHLSLHELSPFHPPRGIFDRILRRGEPAILFEDKVLYTLPSRAGDGIAGTAEEAIDGLFHVTPIGGDADWVRVAVDDGARPHWAIVCAGGTADRTLAAARSALLDHEIACAVYVPSQIYPVALDPVLDELATAERIMIVDDGVAGGGWAGELARLLDERLWRRLSSPVRIIQPACATIPAAAHLERELLVLSSGILGALREMDDA